MLYSPWKFKLCRTYEYWLFPVFKQFSYNYSYFLKSFCGNTRKAYTDTSPTNNSTTVPINLSNLAQFRYQHTITPNKNRGNLKIFTTYGCENEHIDIYKDSLNTSKHYIKATFYLSGCHNTLVLHATKTENLKINLLSITPQ